MSKYKHKRRTVKILNPPPGRSAYTDHKKAVDHVSAGRALWVGDHQDAIEFLGDVWLAAFVALTQRDTEEQALDAHIERTRGHIRWTGGKAHVRRVLVPPGIYRS